MKYLETLPHHQMMMRMMMMMTEIPPHQSQQPAQLQLHRHLRHAADETAAGGPVLESPRQSLVDAAGAACEEGVLEMKFLVRHQQRSRQVDVAGDLCEEGALEMKYLETLPHHQMMRMMMMMMMEIPLQH